MADYVVIGGGGHALSVVDVLRRNGLSVAAIVDPYSSETHKFGLPVSHGVEEFVGQDQFAYVIGLGDNWKRLKVLESVMDLVGVARVPPIVSQGARVSTSADLAPGVVAMDGSHIGPNCSLGRGALVNTHAVVEHGTSLLDGSSVAPATTTGGNCHIGLRSALGIGATLRHGVRVGDDTIVGSASYVHSDLPDRVVAFGSPARVVRNRMPGETYL